VPSLGFGEILIILVIALIVFGPRRLPEMGRTIGRSLREFRRTTSEIRSEITADLDDEPPRLTAEQRARQIEERKPRPQSPPEDPAPPD
jgi:sec-independent protein translocase protein TatA